MIRISHLNQLEEGEEKNLIINLIYFIKQNFFQCKILKEDVGEEGKTEKQKENLDNKKSQF